MRHCIDTLLTGGDEVEILIVDDGSTKDRTPEIADEYEKIIRASAGPSIRKMADMARQSTQDSGMPRAFIIRS